MDIIAADGGIGVIEFIDSADACSDGCRSDEAVPALLVAR
jgi:hypothetical protein